MKGNETNYERENKTRTYNVGAEFFLISFISTSIAYSFFESATRLGENIDNVSISNESVQINMKEMLRSMWNGYYRWWFIAFIGLGVVRFLIILLSNRVKDKT